LVCSLFLRSFLRMPHTILTHFLFLRNACEDFRLQIFLFQVFFHSQLVVLLFIPIVLIIAISFYGKFEILLFSFELSFLHFTNLFLTFLFFLYFPRSPAHPLSISPPFYLFLFLFFLIINNEIIVFVRICAL